GGPQNVEMHPARPPDYREVRGRAGGGPIRQGGPTRPGRVERRVDTSPYSSSAYLSPPPDSSWRRTNSDSALHQSAMNTGVEGALRSAGSQRGVADSQVFGFVVADSPDSGRKYLPTADGRPRSSCEVPRVPGINIYPSQQEPGTIQIPIGNNTGSLPDLTNFHSHFPSPLSNPLDHEDPNSSPYSTSPQGTSPSTLSPTSLSSRPAGRFSFGGGGGGGGGGSPQESQGTSPGHSPGTRRRPYPQAHLQNLVLPAGTQPTACVVEVFCFGLTFVPESSFSAISCEHKVSPSIEVIRSVLLFQIERETIINVMLQASSLVYRSGSPGETSHSGPQSPVSPASPPGAGLGSSSPFLEHSNYGLSPAQALALQQGFEQFSMGDDPVTSIDYMMPQNNGNQYSQAITHNPDDGLVQVAAQDLQTDSVYYSQSSQLPYNRPLTMNPSGGSTQQTTPQTPNTPSSIPDIILTDFSSNSGDGLVKELGSAISGTFDPDLFPSDETLREGLGSIDLEGLQMLTDPLNVITDPTTEDNFRMDRMDRL
ncbi:Uncharacterized protein GBIM_12568, partial [Gryllus bimaculatus]